MEMEHEQQLDCEENDKQVVSSEPEVLREHGKDEQRPLVDDGEDASARSETPAVPDLIDIPGVSIVRSNTPRPFSYETMKSLSGHFQRLSFEDAAPLPPVFPSIAPSAPPLPEEFNEPEVRSALATHTQYESGLHDTGSSEAAPIIPTANPCFSEDELTCEGQELAQDIPETEMQGFIWLFEYGLEMDSAILNSPERLGGLAIPYGPAVLKGYTLVLGAQSIHGSTGSTIVAIVPSSAPDAEVWGILYRVPRRVAEANGTESSLLDTIHAAIIPQKFFKGVEVVVHETFREREVTSVTYVATDVASSQLELAAVDEWSKDKAFVQRLATIAHKQQLPASYVERLVHDQLTDTQLTDTLRTGTLEKMPLSLPGQNTSLPGNISQQGEESNLQNTEPLTVLHDRLLPVTDLVPRSSLMSPTVVQSDPWLIAFALYLVSLLLLLLTFAVLQGLGWMGGVFNSTFTPLGVPWMVMMYGLLGGCISSIVTLGRFRTDCSPSFIIITWFTRPFIGSILAVLSYVFLASGVFKFSAAHMPLFLLAGALAGLMESWIFFKRR